MRNSDYEVLVFLLLLISVLFAASGCGRGLEAPTAPHGEFEVYFQAFEAASIAHGRSTYGDAALPISFGTTTTEVAGECVVPTAGNLVQGRYVVIDRSVWTTLTETQRLELILHECGHCLLNRVHTRAIDVVTYRGAVYGVPASIMFPSVISNDWEWTAMSAAWLDELFANAGH